MKTDRKVQIQTLFHNVELYLKDNDTNIVALTTDSKKLDLDKFLEELVNVAKGDKKTLVLSYNECISKIKDVDQIVVESKKDNYDEIIDKCKGYDFVFVLCPNICEYNNYLHMLHFVKTVILVAKRNSSKFKSLQYIKEKLLEKDADILGIVYQE